MLGLPSTTVVGRRLPKEAFYRNLKVPVQVKDAFVHQVERFEVAHSIKPSTTSIPAGNDVAEVLVLLVELRQREVPEAVLKLVAEANSHKLLFVCLHDGEACLAVMLKRLVVGAWQPLDALQLSLRSDDMDSFWDSLASQVVYGDVGLGVSGSAGGMTVEERFAHDERVAKLRADIDRLDARCRKERQINRKNKLFAEVRELKRQLRELET